MYIHSTSSINANVFKEHLKMLFYRIHEANINHNEFCKSSMLDIAYGQIMLLCASEQDVFWNNSLHSSQILRISFKCNSELNPKLRQ